MDRPDFGIQRGQPAHRGEEVMGKGSGLFMIGCLIGAAATYNHHALVSIIFFLLALGTAFGTGKLG